MHQYAALERLFNKYSVSTIGVKTKINIVDCSTLKKLLVYLKQDIDGLDLDVKGYYTFTDMIELITDLTPKDGAVRRVSKTTLRDALADKLNKHSADMITDSVMSKDLTIKQLLIKINNCTRLQ